MAQKGKNNEPLHERLVFGYDGTDYQVVKIDTDGNLVVALKATEDVQANSYGWLASAWQKNPMLFGYSGDTSELVSDLNADAGSNTIWGGTVPAGEIWDVQAAYVANNITAGSRWDIRVEVNGVVVFLEITWAPVAAQIMAWSGRVVLSEGDKVGGRFDGCIAGDDLFLAYHAIRIDIDQ